MRFQIVIYKNGREKDMEDIILLVIIVAVFCVVSLRAKAWKSWLAEHSSNEDSDE